LKGETSWKVEALTEEGMVDCLPSYFENEMNTGIYGLLAFVGGIYGCDAAGN